MPAFPIPEAEMKLIAEYIYQTDFAFPSGCGPQVSSPKGVGGKVGQEGCDETNCPPVKGVPSKVDPTEKGKPLNKAQKGKPAAGCGEGC